MTEPRYFSAIQRIELFSRSGGHCQSCGVPITLTDFHADHITPWCETFDDRDGNIQIVHPSCHTLKTSEENSARNRRRPASSL